jgi:hypothetical protein
LAPFTLIFFHMLSPHGEGCFNENASIEPFMALRRLLPVCRVTQLSDLSKHEYQAGELHSILVRRVDMR